VGASVRITLTALLLAAMAACSSGTAQQPGLGTAGASGQPAGPSAAANPPRSTQASPAPSATAGQASGGAATAGTSTAKLQKTMSDTLGVVASGSPKPEAEQIRQALTAAGVPAATLEVSASRTPTGLDVDSIEAAALQGRDCVIGQIRDGKVTVAVLPVLAGGKCFVGAQA
jgi:hypothetical protein